MIIRQYIELFSIIIPVELSTWLSIYSIACGTQSFSIWILEIVKIPRKKTDVDLVYTNGGVLPTYTLGIIYDLLVLISVKGNRGIYCHK